jgi:hypothetical protein
MGRLIPGELPAAALLMQALVGPSTRAFALAQNDN